MSGRRQVCALYEYNEWTNAHVIDAGKKIDANDLRRELGESFGSVHSKLTHMLGAQNLWLSRWIGAPRLT